jgi:methyl-accepting chemotaxis protein
VQESARQSNDSLGKTLNAADTVTALATQIADASNEQAEAANSVSQSMEQMSGLIADTHDRIREVREESESLANAAQHMQQLVSRFRV